jgi:Repeat of unknown function (DUF5648)
VKHIVVLTALVLACAQAHAAVTITMIDLPLPGSPRILDIRPDNATGTVVSVPGGTGYYGITGDAIPGGLAGTCGPIARTHTYYTARGYAVVLVDRAEFDVAAILAWLWNRDHLPIWLVGVSASTDKVAMLGATVTPAIPMGILFLAPYSESFPAVSTIVRPAQVVFHGEDTISNGVAPQLFAKLTSSVAREIVGLTGGIPGGECNGYHLMLGLESELSAATLAFIDKYNGTLQGATKVPVVEYFNAGFGHYFMTAQSDEITGLDGGAFGGAFVRTGLGFNAWDAPTTGTVPVCRFFTTPGNFGTRSSHFYTADAAECEYVKHLVDWQYEKIAFHIQVPAGGVCPVGTLAVYRAFNNGQTGAPNHRFTTDLALYQQFTTSLGWSAEGIKFCAPP